MTITKNSVPKDIELKIRTAVELKKELDKYEKEIKEALQDAMQEYDIKKIDNPSYYVTLVPKTTYKAEKLSDVEDDFIKSVLDTKKAKQYDTLYGKLPDGITKTVTKHIRWDTK